MAASLKLLPGSTARWRGRRYLIVDYESLDAMLLAGLERNIEAHTVNIHACRSISAFFRFVDFEAFTIHPSPPLSTLLIMKSKPQPKSDIRKVLKLSSLMRLWSRENIGTANVSGFC